MISAEIGSDTPRMQRIPGVLVSLSLELAQTTPLGSSCDQKAGRGLPNL